MQGKNAIIKSPPPDVVKGARTAIVGILNRLEEIDHMISLPEVVLDIVVLGRDAQLYELVFECAALLKEAMHFSVDFHFPLIFSLHQHHAEHAASAIKKPPQNRALISLFISPSEKIGRAHV